MRTGFVFTFLAAILAGCAGVGGYGLQAGRSTEADVRRALGAPALEFPLPEGGRQLAYPRGPLGTETFMAFLDRDGRLVRLEQVLNEDHFARVVPGTTTGDEVRRLIGPPSRELDFPNLAQVAWDYRFVDAWGYQADLSVMVGRNGIVAGKVVRRIEPREMR